MKSEIRINDSAPEAVIDIEGVIGAPEHSPAGGSVATYGRFAEALDRIRAIKAPEITVNIRSTGGDVNDALLIFDALRGSGATVTTRCYGYTASAATVIAQAASEGRREISANSLYLIHCSESAAEGNAHSLSAAKELLDRTDERIAEIYALRSGRPREEFTMLMNCNNGHGRWMTPAETVAAGLADRIIPARTTCSADDAAQTAAVCRLLGLGLPLPPGLPGEQRPGAATTAGRSNDSPPTVNPYGLLRRLAAAIRAIARSGSAATSRTAPRPRAAAPGPALPRSDAAATHASATEEARRLAEAQEAALPTSVPDTEDPPTDERILSPNEEAYRQDALNMRSH